jgi:capsid protein
VYQLFPGEDLDMKKSETPSQTHIPYMKLQLLLAASALDFPYEFFTLDFSTADYSRMKAVLLLSNKSIRNWQAWLSGSLQRLWNWRIAKAMKEGDLAPAPLVDGVSQWFRVEWQYPEEPWVDRQEANQSDMLEWQLGLGPLSKAAKRRGGNLEDFLRQKAEDLQTAQRLEQEYNLSPGTLIKAQIPGQNGVVPKDQADMDKEQPSTAKGGKDADK